MTHPRRAGLLPTYRAKLRFVAVLVTIVVIGLYLLSAWANVPDAKNLLGVQELNGHVGKPTDAVTTALQEERRSTVVYLGNQAGPTRSAMLDARRQVDHAAAVWRSSADSAPGWAVSDDLAARLDAVRGQLRSLPALRRDIDGGQLSRSAVIDKYTTAIDADFAAYRVMSQISVAEIARRSGAMVSLTYARELLSQGGAIAAGALAAGTWTDDEHARFVALVGGQRAAYREALAEMSGDDRRNYQRLTHTQAYTRYRSLESKLMATTRVGPHLAADWDAAMAGILPKLRRLEVQGADNTSRDAQPIAVNIIVQAAVTAILGGGAGIAAAILLLWVARSVSRGLQGMVDGGRKLADELPDMVERAERGEEVDVAARLEEVWPATGGGSDELALGRATVGTLVDTAYRLGTDKGQVTKRFMALVATVAFRAQRLSSDQLGRIDDLHQQVGVLDPTRMNQDELRNKIGDMMVLLNNVDLTAARLRRLGENLGVLTGSSPGRRFTDPAPLFQVVRGAESEAVPEVQETERIKVIGAGGLMHEVMVHPEPIPSLVHLLSELIENALRMSNDRVKIDGVLRPDGSCELRIDDLGVGMTPKALADINRVLAASPDLTTIPSTGNVRLGLLIVAEYARRWDIPVRLAQSPYGGTTAYVTVPGRLIIHPQPADDADADGADAAFAPDLAPRRANLVAVSSATTPAGPAPTGRHAAPAPTDTAR